jgi:hypothetical protein
MRITAHIPDSVARDVKILADNEKKPVSAMITEAVTHYIREKKKRELGMKVLDLAGKATLSKEVHT